LPHRRLVFLLRHGCIQKPREKRFIGTTNLALTPVGTDQAVYWEQAFADIPLDAILTSMLDRCIDTGQIIARHRPIESTPALNEIHLGEWENHSFDRVKKDTPEAFEQRGRHMDRFRPPGGESFQDLSDRVLPLFEKTASPPGRTLMVTHAGVIRVILCHILNQPLKALFQFPLDYGELIVIKP